MDKAVILCEREGCENRFTTTDSRKKFCSKRCSTKKYCADNRERRKADGKKYYADNREKAKAKSEKYRAAHPGREKAGKEKWRVANPGGEKAAAKKYRAAHPERVKANSRVRAKKNREHKKIRGQLFDVMNAHLFTREEKPPFKW